MEGKIAQALSVYDLNLEGMVPLKRGYRVSTDRGYFRFKEFPGSLQEFRFVNQLLIHLNASGFRDVRLPVLTQDNKNHILIGDSIYYLSPWVDGTNIDVDNLDELRELTGQLARLHNAMQGYVPLKDLSDVRITNRDMDILSEAISEFIGNNNELLPLVEAEINNAAEVLQAMQESEELIYRHGDFHSDNVIRSSANRLVILDFDEAQAGNPLWDLAEILILYGKWDVEWHIGMLSSYHQERALDEKHIVYLVALLTFPWDIPFEQEADVFAKKKLCLKVLSNISPEQLSGEGEPLRIPVEAVDEDIPEEPVPEEPRKKLVWRFPS